MQGTHLRARIPRRLDLLHGIGARAERPLRRAENADRALVTDADRARRRRQHVRDGRQVQAGLLAQLAARELIPLGPFYPAAAYSDEVIWMYLARGLTFGEQQLDDDEFLNLQAVPLIS